MTIRRDFKNIIRDRQHNTGESYSTARIHVMREQAERLARSTDQRAPETAPRPTGATAVSEAPGAKRPPEVVEAAVLKVNKRSVRVRILGELGQVTFRSVDATDLVPGQIVTLTIARRWPWRGDAYANGSIADAHIDVAKLGLEPLPLEGGQLDDLRSYSEPFTRPEPYAALWLRLTARPRPSFEFDGIAWGAFPGRDFEDNATCDAAELAGEGEPELARELLMDVLATDLRCIDAHAHLGNLEFARAPERAMIHYEIGVRIAELSLPVGFDGLLTWGLIYNRPFLRCLHGYGLCLWRLGRLADAQRVFRRMLALNPNDNQGVRACWDDVRNRRPWDEAAGDRGDHGVDGLPR